MAHRIMVTGRWAGTVGGWRPAVAGTLNQTSMSDEEASTFDTYGEAVSFAEQFVVPENPEQWRIDQVAS